MQKNITNVRNNKRAKKKKIIENKFMLDIWMKEFKKKITMQ